MPIRFQIRLFTLMKIWIYILASKKRLKPLKSAQIGSYSIHLACHLQSDADLDPVYHFDADPDADLDFYLMRMRIQVTKNVDPDADPDPQHCLDI